MGLVARILGREPQAPVELQEKRPDLRETGASGQSLYGSFGLSEYNSELRGVRGIKTYDQMRRSDAQVRATLRLVKTPIISAQWYMQPASSKPLDVEISDFIWWALNNMHRSLINFIWEALLMLDYGYYSFEKVFALGTWKNPNQERPRARQMWKWDNFAPRHPINITGWDFNSNGTVKNIEYRRTDGSTGQTTYVRIPYEKLLIFTLDEESGDPTGVSILRSAYKHWYYKENLYKVDAIQKERHGIGIPKVVLPPGYTDEDKNYANEMGRNLRTNEKAHVTLPPGWDVSMLSMNTNLVNVLESAEHHDLMIARNVLGQFMNLGSTVSGSRALGSTQMEIFMKALRYVADIVRMNLNRDAIPELVRYNYGPEILNYPELRVRRIGENADWRAFSVAIRNMVEPGLLTPDPELEQWIRDQMDLPLGGVEVLERGVEERTKKEAPAEGEPETNPDGSRQGSISGGPKE